jgi:hypothetical protein
MLRITYGLACRLPGFRKARAARNEAAGVLASDKLTRAQSGILHPTLNFATSAFKGFIFSTFSALG